MWMLCKNNASVPEQASIYKQRLLASLVEGVHEIEWPAIYARVCVCVWVRGVYIHVT